jgi:uncharacterized protein YybS (DUF2232 family)
LERKEAPLWGGGVIRAGLILVSTFLFVALIPLIGPIFVVLTPLPILYCYSRLGRLRGLTVLCVSSLTAFAILGYAGQSANQPVMFMAGFSGVLISEVLRRHVSVEKTFLLSSSALFCFGAGLVLYHAFQAGLEPWRMIELRVEEVVRENIALYGQMNLPEEQIRMIRENTPRITRLLSGLFPALAFSGAVLTVWVNLFAGRLLFRSNGMVFPDFGDLSVWKSPEKLVWILIAAGAITLFPPAEWVALLGLNLLIVCGLIYMFHGLAIVVFFFQRKQVPPFFQWLFYALLVAQFYLLVIVIALGLFDLWVDFRKRMGKSENLPL